MLPDPVRPIADWSSQRSPAQPVPAPTGHCSALQPSPSLRRLAIPALTEPARPPPTGHPSTYPANPVRLDTTRQSAPPQARPRLIHSPPTSQHAPRQALSALTRLAKPRPTLAPSTPDSPSHLQTNQPSPPPTRHSSAQRAVSAPTVPHGAYPPTSQQPSPDHSSLRYPPQPSTDDPRLPSAALALPAPTDHATTSQAEPRQPRQSGPPRVKPSLAKPDKPAHVYTWPPGPSPTRLPWPVHDTRPSAPRQPSPTQRDRSLRPTPEHPRLPAPGPYPHPPCRPNPSLHATRSLPRLANAPHPRPSYPPQTPAALHTPDFALHRVPRPLRPNPDIPCPRRAAHISPLPTYRTHPCQAESSPTYHCRSYRVPSSHPDRTNRAAPHHPRPPKPRAYRPRPHRPLTDDPFRAPPGPATPDWPILSLPSPHRLLDPALVSPLRSSTPPPPSDKPPRGNPFRPPSDNPYPRAPIPPRSYPRCPDSPFRALTPQASTPPTAQADPDRPAPTGLNVSLQP